MKLPLIKEIVNSNRTALYNVENFITKTPDVIGRVRVRTVLSLPHLESLMHPYQRIIYRNLVISNIKISKKASSQTFEKLLNKPLIMQVDTRPKLNVYKTFI